MKKLINKIDVLGEKYKLYNVDDKTMCSLICTEETCDGAVNLSKKEIYIDVDNHGKYESKFRDKQVQSTIIHEIIHASLWEAGFNDLYDDERLVRFLENTIPKINKTIKDLK